MIDAPIYHIEDEIVGMNFAPHALFCESGGRAANPADSLQGIGRQHAGSSRVKPVCERFEST
jgi:hypothetical protein